MLLSRWSSLSILWRWHAREKKRGGRGSVRQMMGGIGEKARQNRRDSIGKINSHVCDVIFKIQMGGHARGRSGMNESRNFRDDSA